MRRGTVILIPVVVLSIWGGYGCGSTPTAPSRDQQSGITADPTPDPTPGTPGTGGTSATIMFRVNGVVTTEDHGPLAGATVELVYQPDSGLTQRVTAQTAADGRYELQIDARQPGNVNALIRATATEPYMPNEQLVRLGASAEKNLRLRRIRTITVGQSATITFDPDSSRCWTPRTQGICEWIRIQYPPAFTAVLEVTASGPLVPTLAADVPSPLAVLPRFSGRFTPVVGNGGVLLHIGDEEYWDLYTPRTVDVVVAIPDAATPQRYEVQVR